MLKGSRASNAFVYCSKEAVTSSGCIPFVNPLPTSSSMVRPINSSHRLFSHV